MQKVTVTKVLNRIIWGVSALMMCAANASDDFITGIVHSDGGAAEAGVWVITQTQTLGTPYRKIVTTDEAGRFTVPELPEAEFDVWVRGYGLVDSAPVKARAGTPLTLNVERARDPAQAALVYPASYWLSLFEPPSANAFRGGKSAGESDVFTGTSDEIANDPFKSSREWTAQFKLDCVLCHQLGSAVTRLPNAASFDHGFLKAGAMKYFADRLGQPRLTDSLAAWGQAIRDGESPLAPPRPVGIERNIVITQWAWGDNYTYAHDEIVTDKRDPTVNAGGPVYGVDLANDYLLIVDPNKHTATRLKVPTRDGFSTDWCEQTYKSLDNEDIVPFGFGTLGCPWPGGPTAHAGRYQNPANPHNPMMDAQGRVWLTTQIRRQWAEDAPEFCKNDPVIANFRHHRQLGYYDPAAKAFELIDTCYGTHHLQFDDKGVLWTSGDDYLIGWFDPAKYDPTDPTTLQAAHGYSEVRIDTNGDLSPDTPLVGFHYGVIANPVDGSIWSAVTPGITSPAGEAGYILRYDPAADSHEAYAPRSPGMGPRGIDIDGQGIIWTALAGSGQLAKFDRSQCKQTWGTGEQCAEAWTYWRIPAPTFKGYDRALAEGSTDMHYYLWVDQFDILGLGKDVVVVNGTNSDSLIAFIPATEKFVVIRVPYPLNTYTRGLDGRIDDPNTGWKGRGLWFTNGSDPIIHSEQQRSYVAKVQIRPDPLAH
ncbi:MAG: streptogramin lyase [Gammaproteobacteria bacterium]|jgi:streptogramin lyase